MRAMSPAIIVQRKTFEDVNNYTNSDTNVLARRCEDGGGVHKSSVQRALWGKVGRGKGGGERSGDLKPIQKRC